VHIVGYKYDCLRATSCATGAVQAPPCAGAYTLNKLPYILTLVSLSAVPQVTPWYAIAYLCPAKGNRLGTVILLSF